MKLTFVSDEKHSLNPLYPAPRSPQARAQFLEQNKSSGSSAHDKTSPHEDDKQSCKAKALDSSQLEESLDADIARVLQGEMNEEQPVGDHNDDKKAKVSDSEERLRELEYQVYTHLIATSSDNVDTGQVADVQDHIRQQLAPYSTQQDSRVLDNLTRNILSRVNASHRTSQAPLEPPQHVSGSSQNTTTDEDKDEEKKSKDESKGSKKRMGRLMVKSSTYSSLSLEVGEVALLQVASVQLGALKSLSMLLGHDQYIELLLVPRTSHTVDPDKKDGQQQKEDSMQVCYFNLLVI